MVAVKNFLPFAFIFLWLVANVGAEPKSFSAKRKNKGGGGSTSSFKFPFNFGRSSKKPNINGRSRVSPARPSSLCSRSRSGRCSTGRFNNQPIRRRAPSCGGRRRSRRCAPKPTRPTRRPSRVTTSRPPSTYRPSTVPPIRSPIPPPISPILSPIHVPLFPSLPSLIINPHDPQNFAYGAEGEMLHPDQLTGHDPLSTTVELSSGGSSPAWIPYGGIAGQDGWKHEDGLFGRRIHLTFDSQRTYEENVNDDMYISMLRRLMFSSEVNVPAWFDNLFIVLLRKDSDLSESEQSKFATVLDDFWSKELPDPLEILVLPCYCVSSGVQYMLDNLSRSWCANVAAAMTCPEARNLLPQHCQDIDKDSVPGKRFTGLTGYLGIKYLGTVADLTDMSIRACKHKGFLDDVRPRPASKHICSRRRMGF